MPTVPFDQLPDDARVWVFASDRPLAGAHAERLLATVDAFLARWSAHGQPLTAARDWASDRFLVVAVDQRDAHASGCSIDGLFRTLQARPRDRCEPRRRRAACTTATARARSARCAPRVSRSTPRAATVTAETGGLRTPP
jgi:hypothetical protein